MVEALADGHGGQRWLRVGALSSRGPERLPLGRASPSDHLASAGRQLLCASRHQCARALSLPVSRRFALDTDAIWVAPFEAVAEDLESGHLIELALTFEHQGGSVGLCTNTSLSPNLALEGFAKSLRQAAAARDPSSWNALTGTP
ncbi:hypothetical protein [Halomonas litopenaei]|uniref:hypothetical protein n=1 Tax=Halomonas litopenaei TaxID=2109328 RepID=UPI003FA02B9D